MTPTEFKTIWMEGVHANRQQLVQFPLEAVSRIPLSQENRDFLVYIGLPEAAAPFLDFGSKHAIKMPTVRQLWGDENAYNNYRVIGSNGSGDPVCIDVTNRGQVIYLNHDDHMSVNFINSSVAQLAYSLLAYRSVVEEIVSRGGRDAYLDGRMPLDIADRFIGKMEEIDSRAIAPNTFWLGNVVPHG